MLGFDVNNLREWKKVKVKKKLINKKLVKFNCCKGGEMIAKWWKMKGALNFVG